MLYPGDARLNSTLLYHIFQKIIKLFALKNICTSVNKY